MVSAGCRGAGTLSQAKSYRSECSAGLPYKAKKVIVLLQANISVTSIYIGLHELSAVGSLSGIIRNQYQKLSETEKDCLVLALYLHC